MHKDKLEDIMGSVDKIVMLTGIDENYSDTKEVLLEAIKDSNGDIHIYGFWSGDIDDRLNDDDLFDIVSRILSEKYDKGSEIRNITLFPDGICA